MRILHIERVIRWQTIVCWAIVFLIGCTSSNNDIAPGIEPIPIFERHSDQGVELYLMPLHDSTPQKITTIDENERYKLSPDGSLLAVYFGDSLRIVDLISLKEIILATDFVFPTMFIENIEHDFLAWSPDGDKLAILKGGPSWEDQALVNTMLVIYDIQKQAADFVFDNHTWINTMVWSSDSKFITFPELNTPCWFIENCEGEDSIPSGNLTTLALSATNHWEIVESKDFTSLVEGQFWQQNSFCHLSLSSTDEFISYQNPCVLGQLTSEHDLFIMAADLSAQPLKIPQEPYPADSKYLKVHWLEADNQLAVAFRGDTFGAETQSNSFLDIYRKDGGAITLLKREDLKDYRFSVPISINFSPDDKYAMGALDSGNTLLMQLNDSTAPATLMVLPPVSLNGAWLPEGYLTQSGNSIIVVDPTTGEWEVVQDNLPEGFVLAGWQTGE
jgi:hypothetical protein